MQNTPKIWPWILGAVVLVGIALWFWFGQMPSGNPQDNTSPENGGQVYSPPPSPPTMATSTATTTP